MGENGHLGGRTVDRETLEEWVQRFDRDGYVLVPNVLSPEHIAELRADLDAALAAEGEAANRDVFDIALIVRMFERSDANLRLFDLEPIVSFAELLIGRDDPNHGADGVHVVHNNSFVTRPGGGITRWHQDDPPHYLVTDGDPPRNVRLPVLLFTANYYLTDVSERRFGGTEVLPGSHLFGAPCPTSLDGTEWESQVDPNVGPAGSVVMFNNQVWHRGGPNESDRIRYIAQVSYARRVVGHKYYPFMNYQLPEHVYADADPRLRRLLGFLPTGAYG